MSKALTCNRGVVQLASILAWGASGRPFESGHSDKKAAEFSAAFFVPSLRGTKQSRAFAFTLDCFVVPPRNDAKRQQKKDAAASFFLVISEPSIFPEALFEVEHFVLDTL